MVSCNLQAIQSSMLECESSIPFKVDNFLRMVFTIEQTMVTTLLHPLQWNLKFCSTQIQQTKLAIQSLQIVELKEDPLPLIAIQWIRSPHGREGGRTGQWVRIADQIVKENEQLKKRCSWESCWVPQKRHSMLEGEPYSRSCVPSLLLKASHKMKGLGEYSLHTRLGHTKGPQPQPPEEISKQIEWRKLSQGQVTSRFDHCGNYRAVQSLK